MIVLLYSGIAIQLLTLTTSINVKYTERIGHLTRTWPLPGRDSPDREQGEIPVLVLECLAGTGHYQNALLDNYKV